jgi:hypothetical protein
MANTKTVQATLTERVNLRSLKFIVKHFDELYPTLGRFVDIGYNVVDKVTAYSILSSFLKNKMQTDSIEYGYAGNTNDGRLYSLTPSLQGISRVVRHTIARDIYWDVDIKNAHPVLLSYYCDKNGIPCPLLKGYIQNRDIVLKMLMEECSISKDEAKRVFLSFINGGKSKIKLPKKILEFEAELSDIRTKIMELEPAYLARAKASKGADHWNLSGSTVNHLMCHMENEVLQIMKTLLVNQGFEVGTFCFDGLMIYKNDKNIDDALLKLSNVINSLLGYDLTITVKEMDEGIELNIPDDEDLDSFEVPDAIARVPKRFGFFDYSSDYCWNKFDQWVFTGKVYDNVDQIKEYITPKVRRVVMLHVDSVLKVVIKINRTDIGVTSWTDFKSSYDKIFEYKGDKSPKTIKLSDIIKSMNELRYTSVRDAPYTSVNELQVDDDVPNDCILLFKGYRAKRLDKYDVRKLDPIFKHIREVYANNNEEHFQYVIDWLAEPIRTPRNKAGVAMALIGDQGTGKNIILDWLTKYVYGEDSSASVPIDKLFGDFNSCLNGKTFVVVDEVQSTEDKSYRAGRVKWDQLKDIITGRTININKKFVVDKQQNNNIRLCFTSNHADSFYLENGDRRYAIFNVSNQYKGNHEYFKGLGKILTQETANIFYSWCMDTENRTILRDIPKTEMKATIIDKFRCNPLKFMDEFIQSDYAFFQNDIKNRADIDGKLLYKATDKDNTLYVPKQVLYEEFRAWTKATGRSEHQMNRDNFIKMIKDEYPEDSKRIDKVKTRVQVVKLADE